MTRARCVIAPTLPEGAGPTPPTVDLAVRFEAVREAVITAERDLPALAQEIRSMRERVRAAHPAHGDLFDVKHGAGGMVDAEFAVQYLVLAHSRKHPSLRGNLGNITLLRHAEEVGLLPAGMGRAAGDAYRELRRLQHRARLDEVPPQLPADEAKALAAPILAVWRHVLGSEPPVAA